jgi:hypothetical protein
MSYYNEQREEDREQEAKELELLESRQDIQELNKGKE